MTPAGTSNELDVQNGWEENKHTHTHTLIELYCSIVLIIELYCSIVILLELSTVLLLYYSTVLEVLEVRYSVLVRISFHFSNAS